MKARLARIALDLLEALNVRSQLHVGTLVTVAGALVVDATFGANAQLGMLAAGALGVLIREAVDLGARGRRLECGRMIAGTVRSLIDRPLDYLRFDRLQLAEGLSLRELGELAREGRLRTAIWLGGPLYTLENEIFEMVQIFESEIGRCYHRLRARTQGRVDAFGEAVRTVAAATRALNIGLDVPEDQVASERARPFEELRVALLALVGVANRLDVSLDRDGAAAARAARIQATAARREQEDQAHIKLLENARRALGLLSADGSAAPDVGARLAEAKRILREVNAEAYRAAVTAVRDAHHRITYEDLDAPHEPSELETLAGADLVRLEEAIASERARAAARAANPL